MSESMAQIGEQLDKTKRVAVRALLDVGHTVPPEYIGALLNTLDFAERYIGALHEGWEKADRRNAGIVDGLRLRLIRGRDGRSRKRVA